MHHPSDRSERDGERGPRTGTPRTGTAGVFENEGQEFGEHDRPGGAGMPGNQGGGRDPGPVDPASADAGAVDDAASRGSPAGAGARSPGNVAAGGSPGAPGVEGRGSG